MVDSGPNEWRQMFMDAAGVHAGVHAGVNAGETSQNAVQNDNDSDDGQDQSVGLNRKWSNVEKKRLVQLMYEYGNEPSSTVKWQKIADRLGSYRTARQVAARAMQYHDVLQRLNIPLPGELEEDSGESDDEDQSTGVNDKIHYGYSVSY